ncbi:MAG: hypothetical protein AAF430_03085 [Myxococcota bacterium]
MKTRRGSLGASLAVALVCASFAGAAPEVPGPSAFALLAPRALNAGFIDGAGNCRASDALHPEIRAVLEEVRSGTNPTASQRSLDAAEREWGPSGKADRACQHLELARAFLRAGLAPEARAEVRRAEALLPAGRLWKEVATYYRAEAAVLEGRRESVAAATYRALEGSERKTLALAARLRRTDLEQGWPLADVTREIQKAFEADLEEARDRGLDLSTWGPRAAEFAIDAGQLRSAHRWLADAERVEDGSGVATVRKADVLIALERREDARRALRRVSQSGSSEAARALARVRLADHGLLGESLEARIERLEPLTKTAHPAVRSQARDARLELLLEADRLDEALIEVGRLSRDSSPETAKPRFADNLDRAMIAAGAPEAPCPLVIKRLGNERDAFLRRASDPGPMLVLGDCFVELGLAPAGLDVYRGLARRFGIETGELGLRIAKASMALDRVAALRASLRAQRNDTRPTAQAQRASLEWRWLETRLAILEERDAEALASLLRLLDEETLPEAMRVDAETELGFVVLRSRARGDEVDTDAISVALLRSLNVPVAAVHREDRGQAWLWASDLLGERGRPVAARSAFLRASELLPEGPRQARARFRAELTPPARATNDVDPSMWNRLSRAQDRVDDLRAAFEGERP